MGITLASFQAYGKVPRETLNRWERGSAIRTKASFSNLLPVGFEYVYPIKNFIHINGKIQLSNQWDGYNMESDEGVEHFYHQV